MAGSPSIEQILAQIRTALFGRDVRENIALGIEKCYTDVANSLTSSDIVDNLNSSDSTKVLSAKQGKVLNDNFANYAKNEEIKVLNNSIINSGGTVLVSGGTDNVSSGVTFTWDGESCHISGTSDSNPGYSEMYSSTTFDWFKKGETYRIEMDGTSYIDLQVYCRPVGTVIMTPSNTEFTVPANATDIIIRVRVSSNKTYNNTVHPRVLSVEPTLKEVSDEVAILQRTSDELNLATVRDVYTRSSGDIIFTIDGTSIKFTPPILLVHYQDKDGSMMEIMTNAGEEELTVPHDSYAIVNIDTRTIQVKSHSELHTTPGLNYVILFYNSNGYVKGAFDKYFFNKRYDPMIDVGFYGTSYRGPTFSLDSDKNLTVTMPNNGRFMYYDADYSRFISGATIPTESTSQTYVVAHDKCLVFNRKTKTFYVSNATIPFNINEIVLFYNSYGKVIGPWYKYYLAQKIDDVANTINAGYPTYYQTQLETNNREVNLKLSDPVVSGIVFVVDHHYPNNYLNSVGLVKEICNQTGINKVFLGGDYINRETAKADALRQINRVASMYEYANIKTFRMVGNHEFNNPGNSTDPTILANQLNATELRHAILNKFEEEVTCDPDTLSYYYDDTKNKIRYFVGAVNYVSNLDQNSIKWIASQFLNVPNNYSVVVLFHTILGTDGSIKSSAANLVGIVDALKSHGSYTIETTEYDYSSKQVDVICMICGDTHIDLHNTTTGGVHVICTTTDSMQEDGELTRTQGTITEQAFDVFMFDKTNRKIYVKRYGAGTDREYTY